MLFGRRKIDSEGLRDHNDIKDAPDESRRAKENAGIHENQA